MTAMALENEALGIESLDTFDSLLAESTEEAKAESYRQFVAAIVAGQRFAVAEIRERLADAGKAPYDLATDCWAMRALKIAADAVSRVATDGCGEIAAAAQEHAKAEEAWRTAYEAWDAAANRRQKTAEKLEAAKRERERRGKDSLSSIRRAFSPLTLQRMQAITAQFQASQSRRLALDGALWKLNIPAVQERHDATVAQLESHRQEGHALPPLLERLAKQAREDSDALASAERLSAETAALLEAELAMLAEHNALADSLADWRTFTFSPEA